MQKRTIFGRNYLICHGSVQNAHSGRKEASIKDGDSIYFMGIHLDTKGNGNVIPQRTWADFLRTFQIHGNVYFPNGFQLRVMNMLIYYVSNVITD